MSRMVKAGQRLILVLGVLLLAGWSDASLAQRRGFQKKECLDCHQDLADQFQQLKTRHPGLKNDGCEDCHLRHGLVPTLLLKEDGNDLCLSCHEGESIGLDKAEVHSALRQDACIGCHDPHASDHRAQLRGGAPQLCLSCHEQIKELVETSSNVHGAITGGESCTACHTGHGGPLPKLLAEPLLNLCLSCHDKPLKSSDGRPLADIGALLKDDARPLEVVREGSEDQRSRPVFVSGLEVSTGPYQLDRQLMVVGADGIEDRTAGSTGHKQP